MDERGSSGKVEPPKKLYTEARKNLKTKPKAPPVATAVEKTSASSALPQVKGKREQLSGIFLQFSPREFQRLDRNCTGSLSSV